MIKLDELLTRIFSSRITIFIIGFATILSALMASLYVGNKELKSLLQNIALLNITIAIGLAAVSISLDKWIYVNILDTKMLSLFQNGIHSWSVLYLAKPVK